MKKYAWVLAVLLAVGTTGAPYAACNVNSCEDIEYVYTHGGLDKVYISPGVDLAPLDCTPAGGSSNHLTLLPTNPRFQEIFSSLLTALTTGKRIKIRVQTDDLNTAGVDEGMGCEVIYTILYRS